jgi:hypothetical protein
VRVAQVLLQREPLAARLHEVGVVDADEVPVEQRALPVPRGALDEDAHGQFDLGGIEQAGRVGAVGLARDQPHARRLGRQALHEPRHQRDFERIAQADAEHALGLGGIERRLRMQRLLQREQQRLDDAREFERARRRRHAVRGAHEQLVAQRCAQPLERAAQRGWPMNSRCAARVTLRSCSSAWNTSSRFRSSRLKSLSLMWCMFSNDLNDRPPSLT